MACLGPRSKGKRELNDPSPASCLLIPPVHGGRSALPLLSSQDLLWAASFYSRFFLSYAPFYGATGTLLLFVAVRYGQIQSDRERGGLTQVAGDPDPSHPA